MTCSDRNNITIRFPSIGLELLPYTVDFRIDRFQFNYLDAKFPKEVGDYLEPFLDDENHPFRRPQPAEVVMDGEPSHWMYFRPEWVTIGTTNCFIELHDPQKHLKYDIVDYSMEMKAEEAYQRILDRANTGEIIKGLRFRVPDYAESHLPQKSILDATRDPTSGRFTTNIGADAVENTERLWNEVSSWTTPYDERPDDRPSQTIVESEYDFDLKNKTALEALYEINDALGLSSWMSTDGYLMVGDEMFDSTLHVASADDSRVWRYLEPELTPPGRPIKMAVVNGGTVDAPNSTSEEDALESAREFLSPFRGHQDDLRAQGVAQRPDVLDGKIVSIDQHNLGRDALPQRAAQVLFSEITNNNSGSVKINPETSGTRISDWRQVRIGDFLRLVPSEGEGCKDIEMQDVLISGIHHELDAGSWKIKLNVQRWLNPEIETTLRYFSPDSNNYYDSDFNKTYAEQPDTNE